MLDYTSLPTTSSPFPSPAPRSKGQKRPSVQQAQVARQLESRNPTLQAPRQLESRIWVPGCLNLIILSSSIGDLLGCNSLPQAADILAQNPANLPKSVLPPAQECQIAHLGTLATPVEPRWHQGLPADAKDGQRPPKCHSDSSQICRQAIKKTSIHASKHPSLGSQRSAAEAVAFSIYIYIIYTYIYIYLLILIDIINSRYHLTSILLNLSII